MVYGSRQLMIAPRAKFQLAAFAGPHNWYVILFLMLKAIRCHQEHRNIGISPYSDYSSTSAPAAGGCSGGSELGGGGGGDRDRRVVLGSRNSGSSSRSSSSRDMFQMTSAHQVTVEDFDGDAAPGLQLTILVESR